MTTNKIRAAKDEGDAKGDKNRRDTATALVERSAALSSAVDLSGYPEVKDALTAVSSLADVIADLEVLAVKLKNAPSGQIATDTQMELDEIRSNLDSMLPPMVSTMTAVESILASAAEMEVVFANLKTQAKTAEDRLAREKERLSNAAKSLASSRKIG